MVTGCHEFYFPINIGFLSSSQLTNSYFSEGWPNHQPEAMDWEDAYWKGGSRRWNSHCLKEPPKSWESQRLHWHRLGWWCSIFTYFTLQWRNMIISPLLSIIIHYYPLLSIIIHYYPLLPWFHMISMNFISQQKRAFFWYTRATLQEAASAASDRQKEDFEDRTLGGAGWRNRIPLKVTLW